MKEYEALQGMDKEKKVQELNQLLSNDVKHDDNKRIELSETDLAKTGSLQEIYRRYQHVKKTTDYYTKKKKDIAEKYNINLAEDAKTVFDGKMDFNAFCVFLTNTTTFNADKDQKTAKALFNLLSLDTDGAASEVFKTIIISLVSNRKSFYGVALAAVGNKKDSLDGEYKKSYEMISEIFKAEEDSYDEQIEYSFLVALHKQRSKEIKNTKKLIEQLLKNEPDQREADSEKARAEKDGKIPEIKLYFIDFVDVINMDGGISDEKLYDNDEIKKYFTLKSDQEKMDYMLQLLNKYIKHWEYPKSERELPPLEIRNSGDLNAVKSYYVKHNDEMDFNAKAILLLRINTLEKAQKLQKAGETGTLNAENLGAEGYKKDKYIKKGDGNVRISVKLDRSQSSDNGCWSCGIELMLKSHGINIPQENIRAFRPDYPQDYMVTEEFKDKADNNYFKDNGKSITEYADAALAFAPDKMVRSFEISVPGFAQEYVGISREIDAEAYLAASVEAAAKKIRQILNEDKSAISFTNGKHYYSIIDIKDNEITCINPFNNKPEILKLDEVIRGLYNGDKTQGRAANFQLVWLSDIELTEDGKEFYNVPSHYLSLDENGNYKELPDIIKKDADIGKSITEQNGIRVKLVGGLDDTAYDRITRNPLDENDLYIVEQAYLPKKLNVEVLKKKAENRTPEQTKELAERKKALLGYNFMPPQHQISEEQMDTAIRNHEKVSVQIGTAIHFQKVNGIFDLKENEKKDAEGRDYLWYKPGAIIAYRICKAFEGIKTYLNYMIQFDGAEKYSKTLDRLTKEYEKFVQKLESAENVITNEVKPEIYPFKGYPKQEKDIIEGLLLLSNINDSINLNDFKTSRYKVSSPNKYNPSLIARYAENIKEYSNIEAKTNLLKVCEENKEYREAVDSLLKDPGLVKKTARLTFMDSKTPKQVQEYIDMSIKISNSIMDGKQEALVPLKLDPEVEKLVEDIPDINTVVALQKEAQKNPYVNADLIVTNKEALTKSEKRREQYRLFLKYMGMEGSDFKPDVLKKLGKLIDDMEPYLTSQNTKLISYTQLREIRRRYMDIQKEMENGNQLRYTGYPSYKKFRQVISKDILMLNEAIKSQKNVDDKNAPVINLVDIFEKSRSITINVNENDIEVDGGMLSSRLHIKASDAKGNPVDGYFTKHEEPFNFNVAFDDYCTKLAGGDEDIKAFLKHILYPSNDINDCSVIIRNQLMKDYACRRNIIISSFSSPRDYFRTFQNALENDLDLYTSKYHIEQRSARRRKLEKYIKKYTGSIEGIDNLIDLIRGSKAINNRNNIYRNQGINVNAKIDKRNSAMTMVAEMLGIGNVLAKSTNMRIKMGGKVYKGTFMEKALGEFSKNTSMENDLGQIMPESFDNPQIIKSIANLQILDYICGNVDRHLGNLSYVTEKVLGEDGKYHVQVIGIQGIDNDTSFGTSFMGEKDNMSATKLSNMLILPKETADRIMDIDDDMLRALLIGFDLTAAEIQVTIDRLHTVQERIKESYTYFEKNKGVKLTEGKLKIVSDEDMKSLSLKDDLVRPSYKVYDDSHDYNLFSRVYNKFKVNAEIDKVPDTIITVMKNDCREKYYKLSNSALKLTDNQEDIQKLAEKYSINEDAEEYRLMIESVDKLLSDLLDIDKKYLKNINEDLLEINHNFEAFNQTAELADEKILNFITKQKTALNKLDKNSQDYKNLEIIIRAAEKNKALIQNIMETSAELIEIAYKNDALKEFSAERKASINSEIAAKKESEIKAPQNKKDEVIKPENEVVEKNVAEKKVVDNKPPVIEEPEKEESEDKKPGKVENVKTEKVENIKPEEEESEDKKSVNSSSDSEESNDNEKKNVNEEIDNINIRPGNDDSLRDIQIINENKMNQNIILGNNADRNNADDNIDDLRPSGININNINRKSAIDLVNAVTSYKLCYTGIANELKYIRSSLLTFGVKDESKIFELDGGKEYRAMASSLNNCIKMLDTMNKVSDYPPDSIKQELKNLRDASYTYYDTHFNVLGIPFHSYGRERLRQSEVLFKKVPIMLLSLRNVVDKLDNLDRGKAPNTYGKKTLKELDSMAHKAFKDNNIHTLDTSITTYEATKRIAVAQKKSLNKLFNSYEYIHKVYEPTHCNEYLDIIPNRNRSVNIPKRAEIYAVYTLMNNVFKFGLTPEEAEKGCNAFSKSAVNSLANKLAANSVFRDVQTVCHSNQPDKGLEIWRHIEKSADELTLRFTNELSERIPNRNSAANIIADGYNPENNTPQAKDAAMKNLYKVAAEVFVRKALISKNGREVLHMIAVEGNDNKLTEMVNNTAEYLEHNRYFRARNREDMITKIRSALNNKLEDKVLKAFMRGEPRANVDRLRKPEIEHHRHI